MGLFLSRSIPSPGIRGIWARPMAEGTAKGRPRSPLDMMVAAIAEANDCAIVTENAEHFAGTKIMNPMRAN
jgi:predicted nucleic acid-binding protein